MTKALLIELGCEELPARFVRPGLAALKEAVEEALRTARIPFGEATTYGTPRRLSVAVAEVAEVGTDLEEVIKGPPARIAFDEAGEPTQAALGFARKNEVEPEDLFRLETDKGDYLAARVRQQGQSLATVVATLGSRIERISFPKRMRWGYDIGPFARPVHWFVSLHGDQVLPFEAFGVEAGRHSQGHRVHGKDGADIASADEYLAALRSVAVEPDRAVRRERILVQAKALAESVGGQLVDDPELIETLVDLTEHPMPVLGHFDSSYLNLPRSLLISEMREHQKYLAVENSEHQLINAFIAVSNTASRQPEVVAKGNELVLRARFEDARFYFEEDAKVLLVEQASRLKDVLWERSLGTLAAKTERVAAVAAWLADTANQSVDKEQLARAALLSRADLVTGVVGEFPELQGEIGALYALRDGEDPEVASAIEAYYRPRYSGDALPQTELGCLLAVADRADSLVGIIGIGKEPTGATDPFALRRAAIGICRLLDEIYPEISLDGLFTAAAQQYEKGQLSDGGVETAVRFTLTRLRGQLKEASHSTARVDAVFAAGGDCPGALSGRVRALESADLSDLSAAFKRAGNLLKKADPEDLKASVPAGSSPPEQQLLQAVDQIEEALTGARERRDWGQCLGLVATLREPLDRFFDDVMVMSKDPVERQQRLQLLARVQGCFVDLVDPSKLAE